MKLLRYLLNTILFIVLWCVMFLPVMKFSIDTGGTSIAAIGGIVAIIISYRLVKRINKSNLWASLFNESDKVNEVVDEKKTEQHIDKYLEEKSKRSFLEKAIFPFFILVLLISVIGALYFSVGETEKATTNSSALDLEETTPFEIKLDNILKKYYINDEISEFLNSNCSYKKFIFYDLNIRIVSDSRYSYEFNKKIINTGCEYNSSIFLGEDIYGYYESSKEHLKLINKQLVIDDSKSIPYFIKGIIYARLNDEFYANHRIRALSAFSKAIELDSNKPEYYILRSLVYFHLSINNPNYPSKATSYLKLAISDLKKAVSLEEKNLFYCFENLAIYYNNLAAGDSNSKYQRVSIDYLNKIIDNLELKKLTPHFSLYKMRANFKKWSNQDYCNDLKKAIDINELHGTYTSKEGFLSTLESDFENYINDCY